MVKSCSFSSKACDISHQAKQTRDKFGISDHKTTKCFEIIHCDLRGKFHTPSSCGATYFLTLVDDYSRAVWVYLLFDKTDIYKMFSSFFPMIKRQFDAKVKVVRSDNGTKFNCMRDYFQHNGILFQTSCVDTPQKNGRVERKHCHLLNVARALRFQANLPLSFWGDCVLAASYIITRTPSPLLDNKSLYEVLFNTSPSYDTLRVFGCLCYAHNMKSKRDKFISRSRKCIFVGYPQGRKGGNCMILKQVNTLCLRM